MGEEEARLDLRVEGYVCFFFFSLRETCVINRGENAREEVK